MVALDLPERSRAARIQERYSASVAQLRADKDLTADARRRRLADLYKNTRQELSELQRKERERLAQREAVLEARMYGSSSGALSDAARVIANRDAADRAQRITRAEEAADLLRRAEQSGDEGLAKAIAQHALRQGRAAVTQGAIAAWDEVLMAFHDARPQMQDAVEEMAAIERMNTGLRFNEFTVLRPSDLRGSDLNEGANERKVDPFVGLRGVPSGAALRD